MTGEAYKDIREALPIQGKRVLDVTCDDWADVCEMYPEPADRKTRVYVHFDDGSTLTFFTSETVGFCWDGMAFCDTCGKRIGDASLVQHVAVGELTFCDAECRGKYDPPRAGGD